MEIKLRMSDEKKTKIMVKAVRPWVKYSAATLAASAAYLLLKVYVLQPRSTRVVQFDISKFWAILQQQIIILISEVNDQWNVDLLS